MPNVARDVAEKECRRCKRPKPLGDFPKDRTKKDGHATRCRACDREVSKAQYEKNRALRQVNARERGRQARVGKVRLCKKCQQAPTSTPRHAYCDACKPVSRHPDRPGTTKQRGYGAKHVKERQRYTRLVKSGNAFCARCGGHIPADTPPDQWHLDHTDDRQGYLGPSHAKCNVAAAAKPRTGRARVRSRDW